MEKGRKIGFEGKNFGLREDSEVAGFFVFSHIGMILG